MTGFGVLNSRKATTIEKPSAYLPHSVRSTSLVPSYLSGPWQASEFEDLDERPGHRKEQQWITNYEKVP